MEKGCSPHGTLCCTALCLKQTLLRRMYIHVCWQPGMCTVLLRADAHWRCFHCSELRSLLGSESGNQRLCWIIWGVKGGAHLFPPWMLHRESCAWRVASACFICRAILGAAQPAGKVLLPRGCCFACLVVSLNVSPRAEMGSGGAGHRELTVLQGT
jgi:hypothetical protein